MPIIIFRLAAAIAFAFSLVSHTHMFQLEGYHRDAFGRWLSDNAGVVCARITFALVSLVISFFGGAALYASAVFMLLTAYAFIPRTKAKKPLVYTARVKRMLFTAALIYIILGVLFSFTRFEAAFESLFVMLSFAILVAADIVNSPVEKAVKQGYINDAKKKLSARNDLIVVGITGSYGKTSTKNFLCKLLEPEYNVLITPASYNTPMGVVKTVREMLKPSHEIFICEMGAKYKGDIKELCDIAKPKYGIITAIGPQHLESFGTVENITDTKFELADAIPPDGRIYLNYDNAYIRSKDTGKQVVSYGTDFADADCKANITKISDKGTEFEISYKGKTYNFTTKLLGKHNVQNLAGCICFALDFGVDPDDVAIAVRRLEPVTHRLQMLDAGNGITIIDDAFNANPTGTHAALEVMSVLDGVKIIVTPGMIELGNRQSELNFKFGEECAAVCDYIFLVGKRIADDVYDGAKKAGFDETRLLRFDTVTAAVDAARAVVSDQHKYILLENDLPDNY